MPLFVPMSAAPKNDIERVARIAKVSWLKAQLVIEGYPPENRWHVTEDEKMRIRAAAAHLRATKGACFGK